MRCRLGKHTPELHCRPNLLFRLFLFERFWIVSRPYWRISWVVHSVVPGLSHTLKHGICVLCAVTPPTVWEQNTEINQWHSSFLGLPSPLSQLSSFEIHKMLSGSTWSRSPLHAAGPWDYRTAMWTSRGRPSGALALVQPLAQQLRSVLRKGPALPSPHPGQKFLEDRLCAFGISLTLHADVSVLYVSLRWWFPRSCSFTWQLIHPEEHLS